MRRKILHLMKVLLDPYGGLSYQYFIPKELEKNYNNFIIVTGQRKDVLEKMNVEIPVKYTCTQNILSTIKELYYNKPTTLILYHHFGFPTGIIFLTISKLLGIRTILITDFGEHAAPTLKQKSILQIGKDIARCFIMQTQVILATKIVLWTKYELDTLSKFLIIPEDKTHIIPLGHEFKIGSLPKKNYILTVSKGWCDRKNLHTVLKVFAEVAKQKDCKLLVVGEFEPRPSKFVDREGYESGEEYRKRITDLVKKLGIGDKVDFLGHKGREETEKLFKEAYVFYLPSKAETFGLVFIEAMASGTPTVAMRNTSVQYIVKDGITGFLKNTSEEQREILLRMFNDYNLYNELQQNCLKESEKYRWENIIGEWRKVIDDIY